MFMGDYSCSRVLGFNPGAAYWMDIWTFFQIDCAKNCNFCLKSPKINEKEAGVGPFKKNLLCSFILKSHPRLTKNE